LSSATVNQAQKQINLNSAQSVCLGDEWLVPVPGTHTLISNRWHLFPYRFAFRHKLAGNQRVLKPELACVRRQNWQLK